MQHRRSGQPRNPSEPNIRTVSAIPDEVASDFLVRHLKSTNLRRRGTYVERTPDLQFASNAEFWKYFLDQPHRNMRWIKLDGFQLIDWYPRAPGLYHTQRAKFSREA